MGRLIPGQIRAERDAEHSSCGPAGVLVSRTRGSRTRGVLRSGLARDTLSIDLRLADLLETLYHAARGS